MIKKYYSLVLSIICFIFAIIYTVLYLIIFYQGWHVDKLSLMIILTLYICGVGLLFHHKINR
jgi:nicotinamide riboside transporter PnuC